MRIIHLSKIDGICDHGAGADAGIHLHGIARQAASASLEICRAIGDRQCEAAALNNLGLCAIVQGDHAEAQQCWNASVAIYRELGLEKRAAPGLHNLGISYIDSGDLPAAQRCLEQALVTNRTASLRRDQALDLGWLGKLHWLLQDHDTAATMLEQALVLDEEIGGGEEQDWHLVWRAAVACESGNISEAWHYLQQAERLFPECANLKRWDLLQWRASILLAEGQVEAALQAAEQALAEMQSGGSDASTRGAILALLGGIHACLHPEASPEAERCFQQALAQLPDAAPTLCTRALVLQHYAAFLIHHGQAVRARACQAEAQAIFERMGVPAVGKLPPLH